MKNLKYTVQKEDTTKFGNGYVKKVFVNEIHICTLKKGQDLFCVVKNGLHSNIRTKGKITYSTSWNYNGLEEFLGINFNKDYFKDDYPDTTWGYQGAVISLKRIKEIINGVINKVIVNNKNSKLKEEKMKKEVLLKAAKEVKTELGFEEIDLKGDLKYQLIEVASLIGADGEDAIEEDELDDLTKETKAILLELKDGVAEETPEEERPAKKKATKKAKAKKEVEPEPEEETETETEDSLVEQVKVADLTDLKILIKSEGKEVFPIASRGLPLQKNLEKLQAKALKDLGEEVEESEEEKPAKEKKAKKEKAEKAPKKEARISAMKFIQTEICKNFKITTEKIVEKLQKAGYETTSERYVDMRRKEALGIITILQELEKLD